MKRGKQIYSAYCNQRSDSDSEHVMHWHGFVDFCENKSNEVKKSTWRQYRASICYYLEKERGQFEPLWVKRIRYGDDPELCIDEVCLSINAITYNQNYKKKKTSASKRKSVTYGDLYKLVQYIQTTKSKFSEFIVLMLIGSTHLGLRPIEWLSAKLEQRFEDGEDFAILTVKNGKGTNGRACGEFREITIRSVDCISTQPEYDNSEAYASSLQSEIISLVSRLIKQINLLVPNGDKKTWNKVYSSASRHLLNCNNTVFELTKHNIVFYSGRHQFSADLKSSGCDRVIQAALMGHLNTSTSAETYGKKRNGRKTSKINLSAAEANTSKVKQDHKSRPASKGARIKQNISTPINSPS